MLPPLLGVNLLHALQSVQPVFNVNKLLVWSGATVQRPVPNFIQHSISKVADSVLGVGETARNLAPQNCLFLTGLFFCVHAFCIGIVSLLCLSLVVNFSAAELRLT